MAAKLFCNMRKAQRIFSPVASRILRALLIQPYNKWTIESLSKEADVSLGYTHAIVMSLLDQGHVIRDESHSVIVSDPVRLIRRWASYHNYVSSNTFLRYHTFETEIEPFISKMKNAVEHEYALTALTGASLVAPYVRPTTAHFYIRQEGDAGFWAELLNLRPVETGGNVSMVLPYDKGVFYGKNYVNELSVVNKVQLYVDLFNYPARGEEAAEAVLRVLEKEWAME
jgi:hypothetical protein